MLTTILCNLSPLKFLSPTQKRGRRPAMWLQRKNERVSNEEIDGAATVD